MATGLQKGRDILGGKENVIAVIGDGSLSGGEAFEGLDTAAELGTNIIVVVNPSSAPKNLAKRLWKRRINGIFAQNIICHQPSKTASQDNDMRTAMSINKP